MKTVMGLCPSWNSARLGHGSKAHRSVGETWGVQRDARTPGEEARCSGLRFRPLDLTTPISPQSLEKMNIEQKMSIRILK